MKALLAILGPRETATFPIVSFSMVEPSTNTIRFETTDGAQLESRGSPFMIVAGDINKLPPFEFKGQPTQDPDTCSHDQPAWNIAGYWQCAKCGHRYARETATAHPERN